MTAPTADATGLSDATGASVSIVMDSFGGAIGSTVSVLALPLALGLLAVLLLSGAIIGRKIVRALRRAARQADPRDRYDENAPELLSEWAA